jgi:hypothetical protein
LQNLFCVVRKFFPFDKNYLLEGAQLRLQEKLLLALIEKVKDHYFILYNPLRIPDNVSVAVEKYQPENIKPLKVFYQNLAGVYRYKFGDNQLEFLWDGTDHLKKYESDWTDFFHQHTSRFCRQELFIRAVLDLSVFLPKNKAAQLAENRMNNFIRQHFDLKIHKQRGIVEMKVA